MFAEGLADSATQFRHSSRRLKQKAWWQQCRLKLILASIILIILIVISKFVHNYVHVMLELHTCRHCDALYMHTQSDVEQCKGRSILLLYYICTLEQARNVETQELVLPRLVAYIVCAGCPCC